MDVRKKLAELLSEYFDIGDSYAYNLTRVKSAFACGTMGFDDFEEFDEETVEDIAAHLISHGVTVQEWISVNERLPQNFVSVLGYMTDAGEFPPVRECYTVGNAFFFPALGDIHPVSHWREIPEPPKKAKGEIPT